MDFQPGLMVIHSFRFDNFLKVVKSLSLCIFFAIAGIPILAHLLSLKLTTATSKLPLTYFFLSPFNLDASTIAL